MDEPDRSLGVTFTLLEVELLGDMDREMGERLRTLAEYLRDKNDKRGMELLVPLIVTLGKSNKIVDEVLAREIKRGKSDGAS